MTGDDRLWMFAAVGGYFAVLIFLGLWHSRKIRSSSDYMVAGRGLGFWSFVLLLTGSAASGMTILGVSGLGFTTGWPSFWEQLAVPLSCSVCMILFGVKLSRLADKRGYMTIEDYLCERYESERSMRLLSSVAVGMVSMVYLVGQFAAVGLILSWMLGIGQREGLMIGAVITMTYVLLGGLRAIASIASVQVVVMIVGVAVLCPLIISQAADFNEVLAGIDQNMVEPFFPQAHPPYAGYAFLTPVFSLSLGFFLVLGLSSAPHVVNNVLAVNNRKIFKWAPLVVFIIYFLMISLIKVSGFATRAMAERGLIDVSEADSCFIVAVEYILSDMKILAVLAGTVILAAVMTTTDRLMLTIGNCVSWDIYKQYIHREASDSVVNGINRLTVLMTTALGMFCAMQKTRLLAFLIWAAIGIMFSAFTVPLLGGLYWKRGTRAGGICAMSLGFVSAVVFAGYNRFVSPLPVHFSILSFALALVSFVGVSLLTEAPSREILEKTETGFFVKPNDGN